MFLIAQNKKTVLAIWDGYDCVNPFIGSDSLRWHYPDQVQGVSSQPIWTKISTPSELVFFRLNVQGARKNNFLFII